MAGGRAGSEDDDQEAVGGLLSSRSLAPRSPTDNNGSHRKLRFYGHGMPYLKDLEVKGHLIVIEGPDASGRSTHTQSGLL